MKNLTLLIPLLLLASCAASGEAPSQPVATETIQAPTEAKYQLGFEITTPCPEHGSHTGIVIDRQYVRAWEVWMYQIKETLGIWEDSWIDEVTLDITVSMMELYRCG